MKERTREKIIDLIKEYRAKSEKGWSPVFGFRSEQERIEASIYDGLANALEGILEEDNAV